jgi:hypothetical protein
MELATESSKYQESDLVCRDRLDPATEPRGGRERGRTGSSRHGAADANRETPRNVTSGTGGTGSLKMCARLSKSWT